MIQLQHVSVGHGSQILFSEINCAVSGTDRRRIALLGDNGCGKSTFFATLLGEIPTLAGSLIVQREQVVALAQTHEFPDVLVGELLEQECSSWETYRIPMVLAQVGLAEEIILESAALLSGGQQMRLAIARALLLDPTILLMDEPTNHLDYEGLRWLGTFIQEFAGSVVIITHDRWFITEYIQELWYLDLTHETLVTYRGNYMDFLEWKRKEEETLRNAHDKLTERKRQLQRWLSEHEFHPKYQFSSIVGARKRTLAALERIETVKPVTSKEIRTVIPSGITKDQLLLDVQIEAHPYIRRCPLSFRLRAQEVVRISGPNGTGKSTLLRILALRELQTVYYKEEIQIGYLTQQGSLDQKQKVITEAHAWLPRLGETDVRRVLHQLGFMAEDMRQRIGSFSPGEQRKLELGLLLAQNPDVLLLDEPTNHMDITTRECIEEIIRETTSAVILVSHDDFFCQQIAVTREVGL